MLKYSEDRPPLKRDKQMTTIRNSAFVLDYKLTITSAQPLLTTGSTRRA